MAKPVVNISKEQRMHPVNLNQFVSFHLDKRSTSIKCALMGKTVDGKIEQICVFNNPQQGINSLVQLYKAKHDNKERVSV